MDLEVNDLWEVKAGSKLGQGVQCIQFFGKRFAVLVVGRRGHFGKGYWVSILTINATRVLFGKLESICTELQAE